MSINTEIARIKSNIAAAYAKISSKGGTLPAAQNSANLAAAIDSITTGGSSKNVQANGSYKAIASTAYTATGVSVTVAKTGIYKVSWMGYRSTNGGTNGSQLYINNSAYGSAQTTFVNTYGQHIELNNVSLTAGQVVEIRARSRSTAYYMGVGNLIIEEV